MSSPLRKKRGNTIIWVLMAMLILGLGGFGARNLGSSVQAIGSVGDREISVQDYGRALSREMQATSAQVGQPITFAMAQELGIDRSVQARLLASAALEGEAARIGISVGDEEVRKRLLGFPAFQGLDGKFDRDAYKLALQSEGLTEGDFETRLRDEAARTLLQGAALGAAATPDALNGTITAWATETRDFTVAELISSDLTAPVAAPTDDQIKAHYDAHPEPYTRPETRRITYVWLTPDMLADTVQLDDAALKKTYEERISEFVTPEKRLVEKLVYPDAAAAQDARDRLDAGQVDFAGLAQERGLELADADLGEVAKEELGAAGDAVFALTEPGVVGPIDTDLGPALFAMNGILDAQETTFDEAKEDLSAEARYGQARRMIANETNALEDLMASGASLDDVAKESDMELGTIAFSAGTEDGIAAYAPFRDAAATATAGDFPQLVALDDGGIFALRLDGIDPPALKPLEEVRDEVVADWTRDATRQALVNRAAEVAAATATPEDLESSGLVTTRYDAFARNGHIDGTPVELAERAFAMEAGKTEVVEAGDRVFVVALRAVQSADPTDPDVVSLRRQVDDQMNQAFAQDVFQLFTQAIEARAGIRLNQAAIAAVNAQMN
jgi:peptidyl-prolyl cis-trans isomerase D